MCFFFSSRRRHTRWPRDWSSDVCSSDLRSYYNDEEHQERMALVRGRPVENKGIGIRIDDPAPDFAKIAQGFGIYAEGPVEDPAMLPPALKRALRVVRDERRPALIDRSEEHTSE